MIMFSLVTFKKYWYSFFEWQTFVQFDYIVKMLFLWIHSISMGAAAVKPLVDFRGVSMDWKKRDSMIRSIRSTWELSESWLGSRLGGTFSEFSVAPSLPSQFILNFVTLTGRMNVRGFSSFKSKVNLIFQVFTWDWWPRCSAGVSPREGERVASLVTQAQCSQCSHSSQHGWTLDMRRVWYPLHHVLMIFQSQCECQVFHLRICMSKWGEPQWLRPNPPLGSCPDSVDQPRRTFLESAANVIHWQYDESHGGGVINWANDIDGEQKQQ